MRNLLIATIREAVGDPNGCSRYGKLFYKIPEDGGSKRWWTKLRKAQADHGVYDLDTLETLADEQLMRCYRLFERRYNTWM